MTPNHKKKKTKIIVLGGIRFFRNGEVLTFFDPHLHLADSVAITIVEQKNLEKCETVHIERADVKSPRLCCVYNLALTCRRIAYYKCATPILLRTICFFQSADGKFVEINSTYVITLLRRNASIMGEKRLGFKPEEIGTHLIRCGGAMAYFLIPGCTAEQVMFIGRWKSNAFLRYIRDQVDRFHNGWSTQIVSNPHFKTIPALDKNQMSILTHGKIDYSFFGTDTPHDPRKRIPEKSRHL